MPSSMDVNDLVRGGLQALREKLGMSQEGFAQEIGLKFRTYQNREIRGELPPAESLRIMYTKYGVNLHWLITREGAMFVSGASEMAAEPVTQYPSKPSGASADSTARIKEMLDQIENSDIALDAKISFYESLLRLLKKNP